MRFALDDQQRDFAASIDAALGAADTPAAKPPTVTNAVYKQLTAAQTAQGKSDFPAALAAIEAAKAVPTRKPYDDLMIARFAMGIHIGMKDLAAADVDAETAAPDLQGAAYEYEPSEEEILDTLLPRNITVQVLAALLENMAGFYASQMSAMDNATRNAGDMIAALNLKYNRQRQAQITTELIEIISGASAL